MIKKACLIATKLFLLINIEKSTLVILTPGFPESEADTTCLPMQQSFIICLKERYPQLNIIVLSFQYPYYKKIYKWFDTTVISFNGQNKTGLTRLLNRNKLSAALKEINHNNKVVGILSFWYGECAFTGKRFADKNNIKHFCWILGQDAKKGNPYPERLRANANELVALSDFLQVEFEKNHGVRPLHLIPPGIDSKHLNIYQAKKNVDILAAGSLIPLKRYDLFLKIITEIKKELPEVNVVLAGDGPEKENLLALVSKYGLKENCTLTGELPHYKVLELMQRSKILLHPSSYEGFSGVCLEALACGAHVISFCKPMKQDIDHWHIVQSREEMQQKAIAMLQGTHLSYSPSLPFLMTDTVKAFMVLFN